MSCVSVCDRERERERNARVYIHVCVDFFYSIFFLSEKSYLYEPKRWASACEEPRDVVVWNIGLFSTIMAVNGLLVIFCLVQILRAVHGVIFGPSKNKVQLILLLWGMQIIQNSKLVVT